MIGIQQNSDAANLHGADQSEEALVSQNAPARNILLIHEILPHFDCSGADLRLFELVRELRRQNHHVTFLARSGRDELQYRPPLEALGATVFSHDSERLRHTGDAGTASWNLREVLEQGRFDIAILSHWFWSGISVPEHYLDKIRRWSPRTRILVLSEDRHGERERRSAQLSGLLSDFERGEEFEQREKEIYQRADLLLYVTETDARHFLTLLPDLQTEHLPTIAESGFPGGAFSTREGVLFLGNFENLANRDALRWLLDEIWPLVRQQDPSVKLYIAGNAATPDLATQLPGVTVLGKLGDLAPAFAARRVFIGPIRYGTGIITKNMIALAHGLPVVTTPVGAEGLQLVHRSHALIPDSAKDFASSILQLHRDETLWNSLSSNGREYIRSKFCLENLQSQIRKIVARAMQLLPRTADPGHTWSYRAVEETNPEVLTAPANYRRMLRTLAYWQMGHRHLVAERYAEAIEQFRHIFVTVQSPLLATIFHSTLLKDMAHCYRELGNVRFAERCERELRKPAHPWTAPVPPEPRALSRHASSPKAPEISVVIPTYNRAEVLRLCLSALAYQSLPGDRWEVIVVDDGSTDETEALCRNLLLPFSSIRYTRQENQGAGAARRTGVAMARGEFLLLINDDTIPGSNLLVEHLSVHRKHPSEKWAVLGEFRPSQESIRRALSLFVNTSAFFFPQQTLKAGQLCDHAYFVTCNLSIRRDAVLEAGSFDPQFRVAEDTDLGTRLAQRGFQVRFHPDAGAVHEHGRFSLNDLIRRAQSYGAADWKLFQKHPQLLGDGAGPFGRLQANDFSRMRDYLHRHRPAVEAALAALQALDDVDMIPLCQKDAQGHTKAEAILAQLAQVVPIVHWYYLFASFLQASKEARSQNIPLSQFAEAVPTTR
jgi:GT2 family glycosyltransferase/glycosyltransferase involved in cell wall biosynthesis